MTRNKKILIFGGNGWIGTKVYQLLQKQGFEVYKSNCRAEDMDAIEKEIEQLANVTHIMSFIGRTHGVYEGETIGTIDYLEKPGKLVDNVCDNLFGPVSLSILCRSKNIHFTYLGTGCIFNYDESHPYGEEINGFNEESLPNFFGSSYSVVKGYTDQLMHLFEDSVLNVRIRMPITDEIHPRNFITKITNYKKVCSIPNSMTVLNELLPIMIHLALKNKTGTINLTNPGLISHNEILDMYKEIVDPSFEWENFSIEEQDEILASKRSNNFLDTSRLELETNHTVKHIKESVRDMLVSMKNNTSAI
uniref:NAD-dependent epimerase/dehydratase domain-containing protein n=1 Tax=viral metagenome TaxID=1070528 RepID=A0A6C0E6D0_9ZZZZ